MVGSAHQVSTSGNRTGYVPAFEALELPLFNLLEPRVTERTDECIVCETIVQRLGLKGADAAPQPG